MVDKIKAPKMKRKEYEEKLRKLQVELCRLQEWVKHKGLKIIIAFEGRDAAGKGGTIKAITERVSPRVFRVVAKCSCSATSRNFLPLVKSLFLIVVGTIAPGSNMS